MQFTRTVLPNGLRVIVVPMPQSASVTVSVLTTAGSECETKRTSGLAHFLEHMCFKGTVSRSTPREIAEEIEGIGGRSNAFTGHEETGYYIKAEARHFKQVFGIVSDLFLNPVFPEEEIEKERRVIMLEIAKVEDEPAERIFDLFMSSLYGDQPAGWDILGTRETVSRLGRQDFIAYRQKHYTALNTVIIVAGNVEEKEVLNEVSRLFGGITQGRKTKKLKAVIKDGKPRVYLEPKKSSQTHLVLGFHSYPFAHPRRLAASVSGAALGGGMSSRLFQRVREEMGAAYAVETANNAYGGHGEFMTYIGTGHDSAVDVVRAVLEETERFKRETISPAELERVKNHIAGGLAIDLETGSRLAGFYGGQEVLDQPLETPKDITDKVHRVTAEDIQKAARDIFKNEHLCLSVIGQTNAKALEKVLYLPRD